MKQTPIDQVLSEQAFSEKEINAFHDIISYAKDVQEGKKQKLQNFIKTTIDDIISQDQL